MSVKSDMKIQAVKLARDQFYKYSLNEYETKVNYEMYLLMELLLLDITTEDTIHYKNTINNLKSDVYADNVNAGWYSDPKTGERLERNIGEMLMLIVSEVSEAMEGYRKNLRDDKIKHRPMIEVELADACIRIFDLAGYLDLDLGGAIAEKRKFNATRQDHKLENRAKENGKKF